MGSRLSALDFHSIAVLPFRNLSSDGPNAYFTDRFHDKLFDTSFQSFGSQVISRTYVIEYPRQDTPPIEQIARELGVWSVVEVSVQVAEEQLRVHVQLIDASKSVEY